MTWIGCMRLRNSVGGIKNDVVLRRNDVTMMLGVKNRESAIVMKLNSMTIISDVTKRNVDIEGTLTANLLSMQ